MSHRLFLNTIVLGGTTLEKLDAIAAAGFDDLELWREDLEQYGMGSSAFAGELKKRSLGLTDFQVLRDFDGAAGDQRAAKRTEALGMLDTAVALGSRVVQMPSNVREDADASRIEDDLRWLDAEAASRGLRIAYEPMGWSTINYTLPKLWASITGAGVAHIDVVVDAFHIFARGRDLSDLAVIPVDRIANVQFCDFDDVVPVSGLSDAGKHRRLLPGAGHFPLTEMAKQLQDAGYAGPVGVEVFNDGLKAQPVGQVAAQAMAALKAVWGASPL